MPSIQEIQANIIEDFSFLPEWDERYAHLIEIGQKLPPLPDAHKNEETIVRGCQSNVWLYHECMDGKIRLQADSDSLVVKGLAALLLQVYSDQPAKDIVDTDLIIFAQTGLDKHLSSQRANGLMAMIEYIKKFAVECASAQSS